MRRREFFAGLGGAVAWLPAAALPQRAAPRRVGVVLGPAGAHEVFRQAMRDLGYIEGQNVILDFRLANVPEKLPGYVAELIAAKAEVIVASGSHGVKAAQQATKTIPIVMLASDPVGTGFVASLARPGGNITGLSILSTDLSGKRLELMREIAPGLSCAMVLWDVDDPPAALALKETEESARKLGITLATVGIKRADDIDGAFAAVAGQGPQVLIMLSSPVLFSNAERVAQLAVQSRLPSIGVLPVTVRRGLLMSYGPSYDDVVRRSATYVDKILKGASPADLPVEQPTRYELTINLKTANALGLSIPARLLSLADEVIE